MCYKLDVCGSLQVSIPPAFQNNDAVMILSHFFQLYADFYQSDIILASPLGLRYIMGSTSRTDIQTDFLTSVEILILDQVWGGSLHHAMLSFCNILYVFCLH